MRPSSAIYLCGPIADPGKPANGGYQARNLRTIEALRRRGIEVHALPYAQPSGSRVRKLCSYAAGFAVLAVKMARCTKGSTVHITGLRRIFIFPELALILLAKLRRCSVVYDIRDGLGLDMRWVERSRLYKLCFAWALNGANLLMVQGEDQAPFLEPFTEKKPVLIPNQIDLSSVPDRCNQNGESGVPVIAYAGALKPEKGIEKILQAAAILKDRGREVTVRIAGSGDEAFVAQLKSRSGDLKVDWMGSQTAEQVLDLFSGSHFFLFPTWWPGEGQSNALTEAMACGCVPIVSDHGFNAATVGDCGVVLPPDRGACDYASAVEEIWNGGQWEMLSRRAAARVRDRFSSVSVMDRLTEQYVLLEHRRGK